MLRLVLLTCLLLAWLRSPGQHEKNYTPRKTYSDRSKALIESLRIRTEGEIGKISSPKRNQIAGVFRDRFDFLEREFKREAFIQDDSLQHIVDEIWNRLRQHNTIRNTPGVVLIAKSSDVNAFSFGEGTVMVTVGLLSKIRNESQLAFALAHELAHYELRHTLLSIAKRIESPEWRTLSVAAAKIKRGMAEEKDKQLIKRWVVTMSHYSREQEAEADSLGFIYFTKAGYRDDQALQLLNILDSANAAKYNSGRQLFKPFDFAKYPFKTSWLKPPTQLFVRDTLEQVYLDSVSSHPDVQTRKAQLTRLIKNAGTLSFMDANYFRQAVGSAELEAVRCAFDEPRYDKALFQALQLKGKYPANVYLNTIIGRVMLRLYVARVNTTAHMFVAGPSSAYRYDLRAVIHLLNNLDLHDLGEITFRFLNIQSNFSSSEEEHYFLLWKICDLTARQGTMYKVRAEYDLKFPDGKYTKVMRRPEVAK